MACCQSSRNAYLGLDERPVAGQLNLVLKAAAVSLAGGERVDAAEATGLAALQASGFDSVDYFEVRGADDLRRMGPGPLDEPARIFVAARIGRTRLIRQLALWPEAHPTHAAARRASSGRHVVVAQHGKVAGASLSSR